jgi:hypothetical protein
MLMELFNLLETATVPYFLDLYIEISELFNKQL